VEGPYTYTEIAKIVGTANHYVRRVAAAVLRDKGRLERRKEMPVREKTGKVIKVLTEHPDWNTVQVAREAGVARSYVAQVEKRYFKWERKRKENMDEGD